MVNLNENIIIEFGVNLDARCKCTSAVCSCLRSSVVLSFMESVSFKH